MKKIIFTLFFATFFSLNAFTSPYPPEEFTFQSSFSPRASKLEELEKKVQEYEKEKKNESVIKKHPKSSVATAFCAGAGAAALVVFVLIKLGTGE